VELRNHVRQHRARLRLTQQDLAQRVGVRRQTILAIEKQRYVPSTRLALLLARELGMDVGSLFELVDEADGGAR
jgi:putative transcriptional regulator